MARPRKWPPTIHRHHSGQAFIRVGGTDYYLGKAGSPEAQKEYARLISELASNAEPAKRPSKASEITVAEVLHAWIQGPGQDYARDGKELKQFVYAFRPLERLHGSLAAKCLSADELEAVREAMITGSWIKADERAELVKRKRPIGWCRNVVNRQVVRIRTAWKWAERKKLVPPGSHAHLQTLGPLKANHARVRVTSPVKPPTWEHVQQVIAVASPQPAAMLELIWWTGMRPDEVRGLNLEELDCSGEVWRYDPAKHKNAWRGQERIVPLGARAQAILQPWIAKATAEGVTLLFPALGKGYDAFSFAQAIRRACKRAKVPHFTPKSLRHAAKRRITRELGMDAARAVLGQKSIETTNRYDAEVDIEHAVEIAKKMG